MRRLLACLILSTTSVLAQTAALPAPTHPDVSYGPHERHKLDVWCAKSAQPTPLLIFIHGGGWGSGEKTSIPPALLSTMLAKGISVASINYRYTKMAILPGPVHDAAHAVQFLRSKSAEWNFNPKRVGAYGVSAGGCTTLWLAYHDDLADPTSTDPIARQSTRLQAAVGISPQSCIEPQIVTQWIGPQVLQHPMIARSVQAQKTDNLLKPKPEWAKLFHEFSAINHVTPDDPWDPLESTCRHASLSIL